MGEAVSKHSHDKRLGTAGTPDSKEQVMLQRGALSEYLSDHIPHCTEMLTLLYPSQPKTGNLLSGNWLNHSNPKNTVTS